MIRGAVEKTLKGILTICTVLVFPVVVALWWTIYIGVKRFRYGGSVVPPKPPASVIHVTSLQSTMKCDVHIRKESYAKCRVVKRHEHGSGDY